MRPLTYLVVAYFFGLAVAVDFVRPFRGDNEPINRFNDVLGRWKNVPVPPEEAVPSLIPDDSDDDDDFPEEPGTPRYD